MNSITILIVMVGNFITICTVTQNRLLAGLFMTAIITVVSFLGGMAHVNNIKKGG